MCMWIRIYVRMSYHSIPSHSQSQRRINKSSARYCRRDFTTLSHFLPWVFPTLCCCHLLLSCVRFSTVKFCSCRTFLLLLFDAFSLLFSRNIDFSLYFSKSAGRWADGRILKCFKFWAKGVLEDEAEHGHPPTLFSLAFIILSLLLPLLPCQSKLPIPPILSLSPSNSFLALTTPRARFVSTMEK